MIKREKEMRTDIEIPEGYKGYVQLCKRFAYRTDSIDPNTGKQLKISAEQPIGFIPTEWGSREMKELRAAELSGAITVHIVNDESYIKSVAEVKSPLAPYATPSQPVHERITGEIEGLGRPLAKMDKDERARYLFPQNPVNDPGEMPEGPTTIRPKDYSIDTVPVLPDDPEPYQPANPVAWNMNRTLDTAPSDELMTKGWDLGERQDLQKKIDEIDETIKRDQLDIPDDEEDEIPLDEEDDEEEEPEPEEVKPSKNITAKPKKTYKKNK